MRKISIAILLFSALALLLPSVYAVGYGTSSITLSTTQLSFTLTGQRNAVINYTVNLASGNTWGTTLAVVNNNQLSAQGIMTSISNPSGDPPYSGTLTVSLAASATNGEYSIILAATGDDPSASNATVSLTVANPSTTVTTIASQSNGTVHGVFTTINVTSTIPAATLGSTSGVQAWSMNKIMLYALVIIIIILAALSMLLWKALPTRLTVIGVALLVIGTAAWLYGDYSGGNFKYIWGGVAAIVVGALLWIYADRKLLAHRSAAAMLAWVGVILIGVGTIAWLYGDYTGGQLQYVWSGAIAILLGTLIWIVGDWKVGAFLRSVGKKKS